MTALEAYHSFLLKVNRNDSQQHIQVSVPRFVQLFREQALLWFDKILLSSRLTRTTKDLQYLQKHDRVDPVSSTEKRTAFDLPSDYYQFKDLLAKAHRGDCKKELYLYELLDNTNLQDSFTKPSFDWEETLYQLESDQIQIYHDDFLVDELEITYYRNPGTIDIGGYVKTTNEPSYQIDPILTDLHVIEVINQCALEYIREVELAESFQLAQTRNQ